MTNIEFENFLNKVKLNDSEKRELSKFISKLKKDTIPDSNNCVICGKEVTSFCKSHSIPAFVLKQISDNGRIVIGSDLVVPFDDKHGVSNTLTFSCICNECDNQYFQEYENPELLNSPNANDLCINEIAVKCYLRLFYKRTREQKIWEHLIKINGDPYFYQKCKNKLLTADLDISDAEKKIRRLLKRKDEHNFYMIDEINLSYQSEIAYQGVIALSQGFDGEVNNLHNYDPKYKIEHLFLCVFPFSGKTKILVFCEDGGVRMKRFYKKYKKMSLEEKLYVLNYIILLYEEEWCVSSAFDKRKLNKETLRIINQMSDLNVTTNNMLEYIANERQIITSLTKDVFGLKTSGDVYNFLANHQIDK